MKFNIGKYRIIFELAPKGTIWWVQLPKTKHHPLQRIDGLLTIERAFIREMKVYIYTVHVGRLQILIADRTQVDRSNG